MFVGVKSSVRNIITVAGVVFVCIQIFIALHADNKSLSSGDHISYQVLKVSDTTAVESPPESTLDTFITGVTKDPGGFTAASFVPNHMKFEKHESGLPFQADQKDNQLRPVQYLSPLEFNRSQTLSMKTSPVLPIVPSLHSELSTSKATAFHQLSTSMKQGLGSRLLFFLHLHKAGGTTLCHNARIVNGLNAPIRNCNAPGDGPRTLRDGINGFGNLNWTCEARYNYMAQNCIQFFATERWLDKQLCPSRFMYITVLRDPIKRIESNCRFEKVKPETALFWLRTSHFPEEKVYLGTAAVDNFYVRSFAGYDVFHRPAGSISFADLAVAEKHLQNFEIILILEQMDRGLVQMEKLLGWKMPKSVDSHRSFGSGDVTIKFSAVQRRILREYNKIDVQFYDYAVQLSSKLIDSIQEAPTEQLPEIRPPNMIGVGGTSVINTKKKCAAVFSKWKSNQEARRLKHKGAHKAGH